MDNLFKNKGIFESIYLTVIIVISAMIGIYIPTLKIISIFFSIIPLVIITVRKNERLAIVSTLAAYVFIILLTGDIILATTTAISFSFLGLVLGYGMKRRWEIQQILVSSSGAYLFSLLVTIFLFNYITGVNQIDALVGRYIETFDLTVKEMNNMFGDIQIPADRVTATKNLFTYLVPGLFILSSSFFAFISFMMSKSILSRMGEDYTYIPAFAELRVSRKTTLAFMICFILFVFMEQTVFTAALLNIALILAAVLVVAGLSIVDFFVKKAGIPTFVRAIIYIMGFGIIMIIAMVIPILHPLYILVILTLMDATLDFRKLKDKGETHG